MERFYVFDTAYNDIIYICFIRNAARKYMEHQPLGTPVTVESDGEFKEGQLRQRVAGQGVLLVTTVINVKATEGNKDLVSLYTLRGPSGTGVNIPHLSDINRWVHDDERCFTR